MKKNFEFCELAKPSLDYRCSWTLLQNFY